MTPAFKSWLKLVYEGQELRPLALFGRVTKLLFTQIRNLLRGSAELAHT
jgi:hypothetical protein